MQNERKASELDIAPSWNIGSSLEKISNDLAISLDWQSLIDRITNDKKISLLDLVLMYPSLDYNTLSNILNTIKLSSDTKDINVFEYLDTDTILPVLPHSSILKELSFSSLIVLRKQLDTWWIPNQFVNFSLWEKFYTIYPHHLYDLSTPKNGWTQNNVVIHWENKICFIYESAGIDRYVIRDWISFNSNEDWTFSLVTNTFTVKIDTPNEREVTNPSIIILKIHPELLLETRIKTYILEENWEYFFKMNTRKFPISDLIRQQIIDTYEVYLKAYYCDPQQWYLEYRIYFEAETVDNLKVIWGQTVITAGSVNRIQIQPGAQFALTKENIWEFYSFKGTAPKDVYELFKGPTIPVVS